jgi:membrane protein
VIFWISSSAIEAIREGLNHAYKVQEHRSFIYRRLQALLFVVLGSTAFLLASFVLIILPVSLEIWQFMNIYLDKIPVLPHEIETKISILRLIGAYISILVSTLAMYRWLPYHQIRLGHCLPGAMLSSGLWIIMAASFSLYLQNFARYDLFYGSLGGIVVTLLFFHLTAMLILYGAHFNRALYSEK